MNDNSNVHRFPGRPRALIKTSRRRSPAPGAGHGEIETAFLAGIRSIRAWRWARRKGNFPAPCMTTPEGPLWTDDQIARWLGVGANDNDEETLLRELEAA